MDILKARAQIDHLGVISGDHVIKTVKYYDDNKYLYKNPRNDNPVVYEVYQYTEGDEAVQGNLYWGLTILKPVYSNDECNMTKGHFHVNRDCVEYYTCIKGEGLLLLMNDAGETWAEEMRPGSLHHINGNYAHRCVNTGDEDLYIGACWPTVSGHDYEAIAKKEFGVRVMKIDGKIVIEERDQ